MVEDRDRPSTTGEIAHRLGKQVNGIGPTRSTLIRKGLVSAPEHGRLAYTVPGMGSFIQRQAG